MDEIYNYPKKPSMKRHSIRKKGYDYTLPGYYYVTTYTKYMQPFLKEDFVKEIIRYKIQETLEDCPNVYVELLVIESNALKMLIRIKYQTSLSLSDIMCRIKSETANEYIKMVKAGLFPPFNKHFWLEDFYDHIIINKDEENDIRKYLLDCLHKKQ